MIGKIIKQISNDYTVLIDNNTYICKARGKFRNENISPIVGDFVKVDLNNNYILEILNRKNVLDRPRVSNIDILIIITSLKHPNFDSNLLDKLLAISTFNNIKPIIIFTKKDLLSDDELNDFDTIFKYYNKYFDVYYNDDITNIKKIFKDKVCVFTGQSGAGKSTLLNKLDTSLNLDTNEISYALGRGKHTTRYTSLINIEGGMIADTPGFSSLYFKDMTKNDIRDSFPDFNEYRRFCKYRDCMHIKEDDCEIKDLVKSGVILKSRYDNYINFINKG